MDFKWLILSMGYMFGHSYFVPPAKNQCTSLETVAPAGWFVGTNSLVDILCTSVIAAFILEAGYWCGVFCMMGFTNTNIGNFKCDLQCNFCYPVVLTSRYTVKRF